MLRAIIDHPMRLSFLLLLAVLPFSSAFAKQKNKHKDTAVLSHEHSKENLELYPFNASLSPTAVTYSFSGGRLGDNLLTYLHAKWFAYQHQIPLLYRCFPYSSEFAFTAEEICLGTQKANYNIFPCPYFPESKAELLTGKWSYFEVDWKNPEFRKIAREMISPRGHLQLIQPPEKILSLALHFREGGGYDSRSSVFNNPKSPPMSYYIECLLKVLELFPDQSIYCFFFTDALKPQAYLEKIQEALPLQAPIVFDYRRENNSHCTNVVEDFFSLFNFDILIRAESNFSMVPSLIHDYAVVFSSESCSNGPQGIFVDKIAVEVNEDLCEKVRDLL